MKSTHLLRCSLRAILIAATLALVAPHSAFAGSFAGRYTGYYTNSTGQKGSDSLALNENSNGEISGTWSGNIPVYGRRINATTAELRGKTATRFYQITVKTNGDGILVNYKATRLDTGGSYSGMCDFARQ